MSGTSSVLMRTLIKLLLKLEIQPRGKITIQNQNVARNTSGVFSYFNRACRNYTGYYIIIRTLWINSQILKANHAVLLLMHFKNIQRFFFSQFAHVML